MISKKSKAIKKTGKQSKNYTKRMLKESKMIDRILRKSIVPKAGVSSYRGSEVTRRFTTVSTFVVDSQIMLGTYIEADQRFKALTSDYKTFKVSRIKVEFDFPKTNATHKLIGIDIKGPARGQHYSVADVMNCALVKTGTQNKFSFAFNTGMEYTPWMQPDANNPNRNTEKMSWAHFICSPPIPMNYVANHYVGVEQMGQIVQQEQQIPYQLDGFLSTGVRVAGIIKITYWVSFKDAKIARVIE
jgi:hypothetical protein